MADGVWLRRLDALALLPAPILQLPGLATSLTSKGNKINDHTTVRFVFYFIRFLESLAIFFILLLSTTPA